MKLDERPSEEESGGKLPVALTRFRQRSRKLVLEPGLGQHLAAPGSIERTYRFVDQAGVGHRLASAAPKQRPQIGLQLLERG